MRQLHAREERNLPQVRYVRLDDGVQLTHAALCFHNAAVEGDLVAKVSRTPEIAVSRSPPPHTKTLSDQPAVEAGR